MTVNGPRTYTGDTNAAVKNGPLLKYDSFKSFRTRSAVFIFIGFVVQKHNVDEQTSGSEELEAGT